MKKKHFTIPVFVPELACPFQCVYCNQRKISGQLEVPSLEEIHQSIEAHLSTMNANESEIEIGFFGGNFTGIPRKEQENYLQGVQKYIQEEKVSGIRLSTRPDYIDAEVLDMLQQYHVHTIELGAQSLDDSVLKASRRGHTAEDIEKASALIRKKDFRLGLQMMLGLPGDNFTKSFNTAKKIVELKADDTRIYPCLVIRGTELEEWYETGKYKPLSLEEAIDWTKAILPVFEKAGVNILRIGLHPSEGLAGGEDLVAGPFHPSFKELVLTEIWNELLQDHMKKHYRRRVKIHVPATEVNFAIGHKSKNKKELQRYFDEVIFIPDEKISHRRLFVEYM